MTHLPDYVMYTEGMNDYTICIIMKCVCVVHRSRRKGFSVETDYLFNASSSPLARRRRYDSCTIIFFICLCRLLVNLFIIHDTFVIQKGIVSMDIEVNGKFILLL